MLDSRRLLLALLASLAPLSAPAPALQTAPAQAAAPATAKGEALLQRIAVIGASLSAGQGLGGKDLNLAHVIEAGLAAKHGPLIDASDLLTFTSPVSKAKNALAKLEPQDPTLVVGLDYLFWFGYGMNWGGEKERLAALELGLKSLEGLRCPILLGDFPDMSSAVHAKEAMLPAAAVPAPETLAKLNERLQAWAKDHPNVVVVPVSKLMGKLLAGDELRVGPNLWPKGTVGSLLQTDGLHPTLEGTTGLWLFAAQRLLESRKDLPAGALETKAGTIVGKLAPDMKLHLASEPIPAKGGKTPPAKGVH
jgi:hypothetical protein